MRKFLINVNGSRYEVEVEEVAAGQSAAMPSAAPASALLAAPQPAPAAMLDVPAAPAAPAARAAVVQAAGGSGHMGNDPIKAPMPGTILAVSVSVGQMVEKNQVVCILEAMKMENEIVAPHAGVIAGIHTSKGTSVNAGEVLISLE